MSRRDADVRCADRNVDGGVNMSALTPADIHQVATVVAIIGLAMFVMLYALRIIEVSYDRRGAKERDQFDARG
jgi:hypothetical protein